MRNLTGQRFGKLTVIERGENRYKRAAWVCLCDCGNMKTIPSWNLVSGQTKSCGCLNQEINHDYSTKHGQSHTRLYTIWISMKQRCYYPKHKHFDCYGGRGITICEEWKDNFQAFNDWAIHNGYQEHLTIDRIDVNGNYEPSNCRWDTMKEQNNNKRSNHNIEFNGEIHSISEWSVITGIPNTTIHHRLKRGWTIEKTLTTKGS